MEQIVPTEAPEIVEVVQLLQDADAPKTAEAMAAAEAAKAEKFARLPTLEVLVARMIQTNRDIDAYRRGEITLEELNALGVRFV
ncbi:hypothetical protein SAMN05216327_101107 [Dyadobacter sp. SG02]|uniref:hypothetical protein n=1 Tax=Dyadobacter sp. SG02 TaxID=1855291 RepID=UPI0008BC764A|nr:hypothetical protein [Dyadobacter sp. SG02]SEI38500.1 hypothetical protein SAMN05216327_101107 [Dyadobacter sp. SG02]